MTESMSRRATVCVQGLGFVGTAMAIATAAALDRSGSPHFEVIGVDLPTPEGKQRVAAINTGVLQLASNDESLQRVLGECRARGNLRATTDESVYEQADIVVVDIHLDIDFSAAKPRVDFAKFRAALSTLGRRLKRGALLIVETTVPPGTCERVVVPLMAAELRERGLPDDSILVAHSYERVMPGRDYLRSITNFWRVYSGATEAAALACEKFLSKIINVREYPLMRLHSTTASETAKVLENSYRAANIAFIHEWGRFAEQAGIDLFQVLDAIRLRPTHSNIRQPGFGVGGYCLTKDPAFVMISSDELLGFSDLDFPFCKLAMSTNAAMPLHSLERLRAALNRDLKDCKILLLGVSYRQDVGDARYSPSEIFAREAEKLGASITAHDPLLTFWSEMERHVSELPNPARFDAVVLAVPHREYMELDMVAWLRDSQAVVLDTNHVLTTAQADALRKSGRVLYFVGKGN